MKLRWLWLPLFLCGLCSMQARADNRVIVRPTLGLQGLQAFCNGLPLLQNCTVVTGLDGSLNQLFLVTTPLDLTTFLNLLGNTVGIVDAEADQLVSLVGGLNQVTTPHAGLSDTTPVAYSGSTVWDGYVNQPAASIVHVSQAQTTFNVMGPGIIADIDTGVDPNHPVLKPVLLSKNNTMLLREPCLPATDRSLLAFNLRASLLDAPLDQLGFHFFLLPGKKRHFGFKCPIARQRDFDLMLSRTHR